MGKLGIFAIRLVLSAVFAFFVSRFFFKEMAVISIFALAIVLLGMAYLFEYLRKRDKGE